MLGVIAVPNGKKVEVAFVLPKSAAAQAGLRKGDIILAVGETRVTKPEDVGRSLADLEPGKPIEVEVLRDGKQIGITTRPTERKKYKGEITKRRRRGETGYQAPGFFVATWSNLEDEEKPPTWEGTEGKVVVIHCFQSW